jgi:hypothetical protein
MRKATLLTLVLLTVLLAGSAYGAAIFNVDPTGTYLRVDPASTGYTDPLFINLSENGLTPGMGVWIQTLGDFCTSSGDPCVESSLALGAVWVNLAAVNPDSSLLYRLSAIDPIDGSPIGAGNMTWPGGAATDIAQDFMVPLGSAGLVTVPTGATYLAVGVIDSWYDDNSDPDADLQVSIEANTVPEPGTLMLLVPGLGLLLAFRRRRKS